MNIVKKLILFMLSFAMLASSFQVPVFANSGEKIMLTFQEACEKQWNEQYGEIETVEYMFYMPDEWKNEYNDYYNGFDPSTYAVGIVWWDGSAMPSEYIGYDIGDYVGYAVTRTADDCSNVYIAEVPADVTTIVWNNTVKSDSGSTEHRRYASDTPVNGYDPPNEDTYYGYAPEFDMYYYYPDGLESMAGMIYVVDPDYNPINALWNYDPQVLYWGEWFYYYGNGEYGFAPTREEAGGFVYSNGEFPRHYFDVSVDNIYTNIGEKVSCKVSRPGVTARTANEKIATVTEVEGDFVVTGVSSGSTTIIFEYDPGYHLEPIKVKVPVAVFRGCEHSYNKKVIKTSTCKEEGEVRYICSCGDNYKEPLPKVSHKIMLTGAKKATYFAKGHTGKMVCKFCDKVIKKGNSIAKLKLKTPSVKYKCGNKKLTVKYKKVSGATGFQVKYKIGKKSVTKTFNTKKSARNVIKNLKKGTYKVYVRAFVKQGKKKAYSSWTKAKTVKLK